MAAIPAPCARVERMRPVAQAGGPQAAERRAVLPARPSGPAPVLGDAGRARGVQSRRKTRFASAGRVVQLARCGEVASPWHASMHVGQSRPLACCSAPDQGRRKIHFGWCVVLLKRHSSIVRRPGRTCKHVRCSRLPPHYFRGSIGPIAIAHALYLGPNLLTFSFSLSKV
jgi:hypothetical protein